MPLKKSIGLVSAAAALVAGLAAAPAAQAADNPYERGPDPTERSIEAARGPFGVSTERVGSLGVSDFGGATIYHPTDRSQTYGAIAISPGFTAGWTSLSWLGERLASQGFVVIGIDTITRLDQPGSRGRQLLAALDYATTRSNARALIDAQRLAVAGHSMGGGGTLEAAAERPSLKAAIPLAPWNLDKSWAEVRTPTLIIGGESDNIAAVNTHSIPFYNSLSNAREKAYMEIDNGTHFFPNTANTLMAKYMISWMKRYIDDDTRYEQFLCPPPDDRGISEYRHTCPGS
ncbi:alpha/beta hydrolase family protein [Thermomonospora amylolytica]|uniref:alpha/beta hydrolase family protein n=1 Tax=Thermomonospora amylolytica TaxID=1411117 RepID=UPI000E6CEACE|nr:dienelactone hydrolase family protein [Thermomonospora amylolytica]